MNWDPEQFAKFIQRTRERNPHRLIAVQFHTDEALELALSLPIDHIVYKERGVEYVRRPVSR